MTRHSLLPREDQALSLNTFAPVLGVRLRPAGAYALLATPLSEVSGLTVDLQDLAGRAAEELIERCHGAVSAGERLRRAADWVTQRVVRGRGVDLPVARAGRLFEDPSRQRIPRADRGDSEAVRSLQKGRPAYRNRRMKIALDPFTRFRPTQVVSQESPVQAALPQIGVKAPLSAEYRKKESRIESEVKRCP